MSPKILVVDDEPQLQRLISDWLTEAGYKIVTASNGQEGLKRFKEHSPDLVISDVWMPGMDGYQLCRMLKRHSNVSVLLMTGVPNEVAVLREMDVGADDVIIKPFDMHNLISRVEALLGASQEEAPAPPESQPVAYPPQNATEQPRPSQPPVNQEHPLVQVYNSLSSGDKELLLRVAQRLASGN